ncbi:uncharacterized protein LOC142540937 isoform X2 [Primulina tabacum]|uniref:uncharacterized protein LOC142540937 isoform X2 n=1 Tax=Primulina tabacum TaxID=48773 RepID=UPI003F5A4321
MHPSDEESADSDDGFSADMEALRRACHITGTNPLGNNLQLASNSGGAASVSSSSDSESDGDHDQELVRSIRKRFAITTDMTQKPLCVLPPDSSDADDCDEDYETLRAIQRRFAAYSDGGLKDNTEDVLHRPVQVGIIDSEKESSNSLFGDRTNAREGFLNCVDSSEPTTQKPVACDDDSGIQSFDLVEMGGPGSDAAAGFEHKRSNFPKSALAFIDAIKKNRSYQKLIRCKMMQIEARMEELKKLIERVKILKDFRVACKKRTGRALSRKKDARVQLISVPKLRANSKCNEKKIPALYKGPPENVHVPSYRETMTTFPDSMSGEKWSKEEKENLGKGVKQQFQGMLLQRSVELFSCVDGSSGDANNIDSIISSIKDLDFNPERVRLFLPKVNWEQLAAMYVPGRSGAECQARFLNFEDPLINHNPWTAMEDKNLLHIVQQRGLSNWIDIAILLGTNRTPFQCLARYQRSLNASILKREWIKEEDDQLRDAVETFGESNWQLVASVMEGRTGTQCSNRWLKTLHPARKRVGKWTAEEDKRMKIAVTLFGPKTWKKVAQCVPGRTQVQCRERWVNCLDPSLNMAGWSAEEDSKLEAAIAEHGYCWSKVAACVPPRTDNQCRRRWKILFPNEVPLLQTARKIQKAALISNFVDRESERPALLPNDFLLPETNLLTGSQNFVASQRKKRSRGEVCEHLEKDASGNAALIFNTTEIGLDEVLRLTNGSELENMHRRSVSRKGRSKRSYSTKQKAIPLSESCSSPCTDGTSNDEALRESALHYNNRKRTSRLEGKRSGGESIDGFPRSAAVCNGTRMIERGCNEGEDFVPVEECPLLLTDSNLQRVTVSTDASKISRVSKLRPRRSVIPHDDVLETPSEAKMPVGDATLFKRQEKTEDGKVGTNAVDDNLSPFPDTMSLMEIINQIRTAKVGKARKKKRTENEETVSGGECVALAIGGESVPSTPWPADVNLSGLSYPIMEEITPNLHSTIDNNYLNVLREFDEYVVSSEMCDELQNAEFLSNHSTLVNFSKPCIVGNDNGCVAKDTKVGIRNEDHGVSSRF